MAVQPIPSLNTIGRILRRRKLTHRGTGRYEPKGKKYPERPAMKPNQAHQLDFEHRHNIPIATARSRGKPRSKH